MKLLLEIFFCDTILEYHNCTKNVSLVYRLAVKITTSITQQIQHTKSVGCLDPFPRCRIGSANVSQVKSEEIFRFLSP